MAGPRDTQNDEFGIAPPPQPPDRNNERVPAPVRAPVGTRLRRGLLALGLILFVGTLGYVLLGFSWLDAAYQAVTTVTTVGFREVQPFGDAEKVFTMVFLLVGVGAALYTLTALLESAIEGPLGDAWGRRRMDRDISGLSGHAIVCGWGRVGRAAAHQLTKAGQRVVVLDNDSERLADCPYPHLLGDASRDEELRRAGIERAGTLVATLDDDAASLFVTVTARAINPDLVIIARVRTDDAERKFMRAGASHVVNPQRIGGNRVAAFALQPHVVDFLDVAMHDADVEFRLEEVVVRAGSSLDGATVQQIREHRVGDGLLLALRSHEGGPFSLNPADSTSLAPGAVVIAIGTGAQLDLLRKAGGAG